ncbi:TlpA family protein disulfide reductase [Bizionia sediminis]|uniref:TlpA family protein disulfide reductase n=2 Tax=Bizionia sediminis TaxID=1737064 RepID=A0ABW5KUI6_9FLAO
MALISPSEIKEEKREKLTNYSDWKLVDANGKVFNFEDAKGKVVFINFWATWCPPCIAEMPSINSLYTDYKESVLFLLVSNEEVGTITAYKAKNDYSFPFYQAYNQAPAQLQAQSIPQTYIIDKSGYIVMDKSGAANWNSSSVRAVLDTLILAE